MLLNSFILFLFFSYINIVMCDEKIIPEQDQRVYYKKRLRDVYDEQKNITIYNVVHNEFEWIYSVIDNNKYNYRATLIFKNIGIIIP